MQVTSPNITLVANILNRLVASLRQHDLNVDIFVLRYLITTLGQRIFLPLNMNLYLVDYSDFDGLGCVVSRWIRIGYFISLMALSSHEKPINNLLFPHHLMKPKIESWPPLLAKYF